MDPPLVFEKNAKTVQKLAWGAVPPYGRYRLCAVLTEFIWDQWDPVRTTRFGVEDLFTLHHVWLTSSLYFIDISPSLTLTCCASALSLSVCLSVCLSVSVSVSVSVFVSVSLSLSSFLIHICIWKTKCNVNGQCILYAMAAIFDTILFIDPNNAFHIDRLFTSRQRRHRT